MSNFRIILLGINTFDFTFVAGLGALLLGPGEADAMLDGGGRALGKDIFAC